jgi:hypothetical protein
MVSVKAHYSQCAEQVNRSTLAQHVSSEENGLIKYYLHLYSHRSQTLVTLLLSPPPCDYEDDIWEESSLQGTKRLLPS